MSGHVGSAGMYDPAKKNPPKGGITPRTLYAQIPFMGVAAQIIHWSKGWALRIGYEKGNSDPYIVQLFLRSEDEARRFFSSLQTGGHCLQLLHDLYAEAVSKCQLHEGSSEHDQRWYDIQKISF